MADDFPAAHSMDTQWFVADADGRVAMFVTGEDGHVPEAAGGPDVLRDLVDLGHRGVTDVDAHRLEHDPDQLAPLLGLFVYHYGGDADPINPYRRSAVPNHPLHIDELPPRLRGECKQVRFAGLTFAASERVQPLEQFACAIWDEESRVAYVAADGDLRPVPGKEDEFLRGDG